MRRTGTRSPPCSTYTFSEAGNPSMGVTSTDSTIGSFLDIRSLPTPALPGSGSGVARLACLSASACRKLPRYWVGCGGPYLAITSTTSAVLRSLPRDEDARLRSDGRRLRGRRRRARPRGRDQDPAHEQRGALP